MNTQSEIRHFYKKVLLIEDEYFIVELYQRILQNAGIGVIQATDGEEGVKLAQNRPDLILLDIMLPKLNGIGVLKKLKASAQTSDIPVVLLTNLGQAAIIKTAFKIGAQGYLLKVSLTPEELVSKVKEFLGDPLLQMDINSLNLDPD